MNPAVGYTFGTEILFPEKDIVAGANLIGDANPIHHHSHHTNDRINGIIASGSHVSAVFSALIPTHFSQYGQVLGLNMSFEFRSPVYPERRYNMSWTVSDEEWSGKLKGNLYSLDGKVADLDAKMALTGKATILLF